MFKPRLGPLVIAVLALLGLARPAMSRRRKQKKPNILVIWGDDVGVHNISAYNHGIMGYKTPNIDRIAREGAMFTDAYAQQSCTAGRASFILGQHPFRTGLLTIGMPGSDHGAPDWAPTIADLLKEQGYTTGQFGKNHLGDRDKHLPTAHGFDEFFGNLYHLNAEEEPETYYYPKDPEFKKKFGPRGVIHSYADGRIQDTGPLTQKRMETADEEFAAAGLDFIERANKANKPFFVWMSTTRMHVWTRLKKESEGKTGIGLYPDGMVEHDGHVGLVPRQAEGTRDRRQHDRGLQHRQRRGNGELARWRHHTVPRREGHDMGRRLPRAVGRPLAWRDQARHGLQRHDLSRRLAAHLPDAAGVPDVVEKVKQGYKANGKTWKVHLDGYDYLPFFKGEVAKAPRDSDLLFRSGWRTECGSLEQLEGPFRDYQRQYRDRRAGRPQLAVDSSICVRTRTR